MRKAAEAPQDTQDPRGTSKASILLVDDRAENLLALESVLSNPAYRLVRAQSGMDALKCVLKEDFAVILLDVQMPGLDGFETAKLIKAREKSSHVPIIFITAMNQAIEHVNQGYSSGAVEYIFKPFHAATLAAKVDAFVKIYQYQEQIKLQNALLRKHTLELERVNGQLRRLSSELHQAEALARAIGDTSIDTILTLNADGIIVTCNPAAEFMLGYESYELPGTPIDRILPDLLPDWHMFLGRIKETSAVRSSGSAFHAEVQLGDALIEGNRILVCTIRDITERKQLEEDRFRKVFQSSPCLMEIRRLSDRKYVDVNESWLRYTGHRYEEVVNQTSDVLHYMMEDDPEQAAGSKSSQGKLLRNVRIRYLTKEGELREGLLATEYIELNGERCILSVITETTERMNYEREIARLDRLNIIGEMAAGITHEIRNPMTTIRGFLQMSKKGLSPEHIDIMVSELDRANNIITEFLTISKNRSSERKPLTLNGIIETLFPLIQANAMLTDKTIALELMECPLLSLDEKEIRQLVLNLAMNGLEAMSAGGKLTIRTYKEDKEAVIEVQDQGSGIRPEVLEKLGTAFYSTKEQGTGLGLMVCHSIAARHQARIDVTTGKVGSTFYVRFPISSAES